MKVYIFNHLQKIKILSYLSDISLEWLLLNTNKNSNNCFVNIDINWLSVIKYQMVKRSQQKRGGMKINNIILNRIKEYPKVTHHRDKRFLSKNGI